MIWHAVIGALATVGALTIVCSLTILIWAFLQTTHEKQGRAR